MGTRSSVPSMPAVTSLKANTCAHSPLRSIIIPWCIRSLGEGYLKEHRSLSEVTIVSPSPLKLIAARAFYPCCFLLSIGIPASVAFLESARHSPYWHSNLDAIWLKLLKPRFGIVLRWSLFAFENSSIVEEPLFFRLL
jgi:hypothetical protein